VESPACGCGAEKQTIRNIVDDCPLRLFADGLTGLRAMCTKIPSDRVIKKKKFGKSKISLNATNRDRYHTCFPYISHLFLSDSIFDYTSHSIIKQICR
jgi:hypothetical protein